MREPTPEGTPGSRRRAAWAVGCFALGIGGAEWASPVEPWIGFAVGGSLALIGWLCRGPAATVALATATVALGFAWHSLRVGSVPSDHLANRLTDAPRLVSIEGMIVEKPRTTRERGGRLGRFMPGDVRTAFTLRAERWIDGDGSASPVSGSAWVGVGGEAPTLRVGDRVVIIGMARALTAPSNPGEPDRRGWARSSGPGGGVGGIIEVDSPGAIRPAGEDDEGIEARTRRAIEHLRANARAWIDAEGEAAGSMDDREARSLVRALLLGQAPGGGDHDLSALRDAFTRLGVSHILSISGLNLAILAGAFLLVLRLIGDRPRTEALLAGLAVVTYVVVIPARAPVLRAAFMVLAFLAAESTGRRYDRLTILAWAALTLLILQPLELFSAGFQLSFGVVAALMTLTRPVRDRLFGVKPPRDTHGPIRAGIEALKDAASGCLVAWAAATPLIAYHVGIFSPLGAPATLAIMPLVTAIMGAGYVTLIAAVAGGAVPAVGEWVMPLLTLCSGLLAKVVFLIDASPWTVVYLPRVTIAWTVLCSIVIVWWMAPPAPRGGIEGWSKRMTRTRWTLTGVATAWLAATVLWPNLPRDQAARLDTIDVSDGSCHLFRTRDGWKSDAVLFDCGSLRLTVGERTIPAAVRALGCGRVHTIVLTHPDIDHYAGVLDLIQPLGVRRVLIGEAFERAAEARPRSPVAYVLSELRRLKVEVRTIAAGERIELAGAVIEVISPPAGASWKIDNDASLVSLISCRTDAGERRILMTGDIQTSAIASIMQAGRDLRVSVMEAPHHGSYAPASIELIRRCDPAVVVQSTGPRRAGDERMNKAKEGRQWLTTAEVGATSVVIGRGGGVTARTRKPAR